MNAIFVNLLDKWDHQPNSNQQHTRYALRRRTVRGGRKNARALFTKIAKVKLPKSGIKMETTTIALMSIGTTLVKSKIQAKPPYKIK